MTLDPSWIALVCITHVPTNSGVVNPVTEIGSLITQYNNQFNKNGNDGIVKNNGNNKSHKLPPILYLLDSCQSVGQLPVHVTDIQCHGLVATGRKYLRGPRGTGFLYVKDEISESILPHHVDHFGLPIRSVPGVMDNDEDNDRNNGVARPLERYLEFSPLPGAKRFEMWESNLAGRLALGEALGEVLELGLDNIRQVILQRVQLLHHKLSSIPGISLHHKPECGICTFAVASLEAGHLKEMLWNGNSDNDDFHFEVSVVPATSTPFDSARMDIPADMIRASVSYTTTEADIEAFCKRLRLVLSTR